jgi:murein L,D-transpeptidase YcbB/YkuD
MKQSRNSFALLLALPLIAITFAWGHGIAPAPLARAQSQTPANSAAPPQQLSPEGQASLQSIIQAANLPELRWPDFSDYRAHVQKFYGQYGNALPWVRNMQPTPQALQMIAIFLNADQKGLSGEDYDGPRWSDRLAKLKPAASNPSEADALQFDAELTVCAMRYISDLHIGKVNPKLFDYGFNVDVKKYDLPEFLKTNVIDASDVSAALAQIEPPYPGYKRTIQALQSYVQLAKHYDGEPLPDTGKTVAPGDPYPGTQQLARLLRVLGDLPTSANVPTDATTYQAPLVDAVKHFQLRFGRTPDGRINAQTLSDLNVPIGDRVREMQLTLERWRWLPVANPSVHHVPPLVANIPEFRLRAYDENYNIAWTMNVVVGKAYDHDTPVFSDTMEYVVFRPYWNVPYSIAKAELLPRLARDPNYLTEKGFQVVDARQDVISSGAVSADVLEQLRSGKLFIRQNPGPRNSLGLVKFIFPNSYNIYMHDTPEQEFFSRTRRDFSHGCIRLEKPAQLAAWVLRDNPGWDAEKIRAAMTGTSQNQQVNLVHPIPVLIVYGTVVVTEDGLVHFYDDIYGHDQRLEKTLDKGYPYPN